MRTILAVFLFLSNLTFAHKDEIIKKSYGNVYVTTFASSYVEEMNKTLIIAKYTEMLAKELNYSDKIYLLFSEEQWESSTITSWMPVSDGSDETDGIHIMFRNKSFSINGCLNVIENSLLNSKKLKKFKTKNLEIYDRDSSLNVIKVLSNRINRPSEIKELEKLASYSYYIMNGKYNFFRNEGDKIELLANLDNILDYQVLSQDVAIVFTTFNTFNIYQYNKETRDWKIQNPPKFYWPYKTHLLGGNKIIIEFFWRSEQKNRVMVCYPDKNILLQDFDKVFDK